MNKQNIRRISVLLSISILLVSIISMGSDRGVLDTETSPNSAVTYFINGNTQLAEKATSGSGTEEDPYVIEDMLVNSSFGLQVIWNTDAYLIVRNCTFTGEDGDYDTGLHIAQASNILLVDNLIYGNYYGLVLSDECYDITVQWNNITDNSNIPLWVKEDTANNTIWGNYFTNNGRNVYDYSANSSNNVWSLNGVGNYYGNYENDYQNAANDGFVWDMPYVLGGDMGKVDENPLVSIPVESDFDDTDDDGLTNIEEEALSTDDEKADTDGDGTSDHDEVQNGTDPTVANGNEDEGFSIPGFSTTIIMIAGMLYVARIIRKSKK